MSLDEKPFDWIVTKAGKLIIYRGGKQIMIVSSKKAEAIVSRLGNDPDEDQQIMARLTGQYRMGNERDAGSKRA